MIKSLLILISFMGLFMHLSCTTIRIEERDAFDAKQTITIDVLRENNIRVQEVTFNSDDQSTLQGWFLQHPEARGTVLYFGGNGYLLAIAYDILMANYHQKLNVFSFDYRGYGQSSGEPSIAGLKRDALAAYEVVTEQLGISYDQLILHGHSLGSFFALYISTQKEVKAVVLESPVSDVEDWTDQLVPFLLKPFVRFEIDEALKNESNLEQAKRLKKPVLIITGKDDKITPLEMSESLLQAAVSKHKRLVIVENGGHNDLPKKPEYLDALADFYSSTLN